jgi:hypothetical protein
MSIQLVQPWVKVLERNQSFPPAPGWYSGPWVNEAKRFPSGTS